MQLNKFMLYLFKTKMNMNNHKQVYLFSIRKIHKILEIDVF